MLPQRLLSAGSLLLFAAACSPSQFPASAPRSVSVMLPEPTTGQSYQALLARFAENDANQGWTTHECNAVGQGFAELSSRHRKQQQRPLPTALYNAGLAFQRCGDDAEAKRQFTQAVASAPDFHQAETELALYEHRVSHDRDRSIERLQQIVRGSKFQNPRALVALAALELERAREQVDGSSDRELAHANLQRALALDDGYLPALNQLGLYHLEQARHNAGQRRGSTRFSSVDGPRPTSRRELDLAALVIERALQRDARYAPAHNTAGLIHVELENYTAASGAFARARELDPRFFEAHMNHAAVNLMFRGFAEAERAYRAALTLEPKNYEAHLGLALALRGQLDASNQDELRPEIDRELDLAARLAPDRPETDYNRALLAMIPLEGEVGLAQIRELERARKLLESFIQKAGDDPAYADSVLKAQARLDDMRDARVFIEGGLELQKPKPWSPESTFLR